jgi:hypothetical protein
MGLSPGPKDGFLYSGADTTRPTTCGPFHPVPDISSGIWRTLPTWDIYQGDQYQYVAFDELGQFPEAMYLYLFSRCRTDAGTGLRCYMRTGSNPGGYIWVKKRFVTTGIANTVGWFKRIDNKDTRVTKDTVDAKSRSYIPATHRDNQLTTADYVANLNQMDKVTKARLADGDWDITDDGDQIYPDWHSVENVSEEAEYNPDYGDVFWACDDGYAFGQGKGTESYHPRVILLIQVTPIGGVNIFAERYATGESDYNICLDDVLGNPYASDVQKGWGYPPPEMVFIDSSAAMFKGAMMLRGLLVSNSSHPVVEGIRNLRQFVKDGNGMRLLKAHPRCENFTEEMGSYRYGTSQIAGDRKPIKADDHGPDGARYFCWHLRYQNNA